MDSHTVMTGNLFQLTARSLALAVAALLLTGGLSGCATRPGAHEARQGDEIVVCGQFFHTGTPVVLWMDPGGYDAYRVERRFSAFTNADWTHSQADNPNLHTPNRYDLRKDLTPEEVERVRGGGWDLPTLQKYVDQFVLHYDEAGTSRTCFKILQDDRGLSVHFMLDLDGTIYQTLDLKERAWQATTSNSRSVGVEIANMGAYAPGERNPFAEWYQPSTNGPTLITIPARYGANPERTPDFIGHPARPEPIFGVVQGQNLEQYDFTPQQYHALIHLTAALCKIFPKITCDYPKDASGRLINHKLPNDELKNYHGVLGHFHIQTNKIDPGPAFQWDYVINRARWLMAGYTPPDLY
jgi:N-acetyl-anhydromuramyl-L-alanine amidase AmpD